MPQRFLKPGLTSSMHFNACSWPAQSLFVRLVTMVDDRGRYEAHPRMLRILFPFGDRIGRPVTEKAVGEWLTELVENRMVVAYEVAGRSYLQVLRWTDHVRVRQVKYPPPPGEKAAVP